MQYQESYKESNDVYTFLLEKEKDFTWEAGQPGLFMVLVKNEFECIVNIIL